MSARFSRVAIQSPRGIRSTPNESTQNITNRRFCAQATSIITASHTSQRVHPQREIFDSPSRSSSELSEKPSPPKSCPCRCGASDTSPLIPKIFLGSTRSWTIRNHSDRPLRIEFVRTKAIERQLSTDTGMMLASYGRTERDK